MKLLLLVVLFCLVFVCGAAPDGEVVVAKERDLSGDIILITVLSTGKHFFDHFIKISKLTESLKRLFVYTFVNQNRKKWRDSNPGILDQYDNNTEDQLFVNL
jgi:hypothetical protein